MSGPASENTNVNEEEIDDLDIIDDSETSNEEGKPTETPAEPPAADDRSQEEKDVAGFLKGVGEVSPHLKEGDDKPAAAPAPAGEKPKDEKTEPAKPPAPTDAEKEDEDAAKKLGLKGEANQRFRDMSKEIREARPFTEALTKAGIKDVATLEGVMQNGARALAWEQAIERSTATQEQIGSAFTVIAAMNSNDPTALNGAYDALLEQVTALGKRLGRAPLGADVDPLADHPDLKAEVDALELTPARALEIVRQRARDKIEAENRAANTARAEREKAAGDDIEAATKAAGEELNDFQQEMAKVDPQAAQIMPTLIQKLQGGMVKDLHPSKWAAAVQREYLRIKATLPAAAPAPAPAPARPRVGAQPMRGGSGSAAPTRTVDHAPTDDVGIFMKGVAEATPNR